MASPPKAASKSADSSPPSPPASDGKSSPPAPDSNSSSSSSPPSPPSSGSSPPSPPSSGSSPPSPPSSGSSPPSPPSSGSSPPSPPSSGSSPPSPPSTPPPSGSPPSPTSSSSPPTPSPDKKSPPPSPGGGSSTSPPSGGNPSPPPPAPPTSIGSPPPPSPSSGDKGSPPKANHSPLAPPPPSSTKTPTPPSSGGGSPPPPSHPHKSPSGHSTPSKHPGHAPPSDSSSSSKIIGVGAGAALIALVMIVFCVTCSSRRRKRKRVQMQYYADYSLGPPKGGEYYSGQHNWQNHNHIMKVQQSPGMGMPSGGGWGPPAPPPMLSGEMMSANFSGGPPGPPLPPPAPNLALGFNKSTFTYDELAAATNGFSQANLLGQGGFGYVHKGFLPNGKEIAVKSLKSGSGQGEREFQAEVEIISRVHHRHLVSLVGYCIAETRRMLVYEFVPNNTMEYHLHGKGRPTMDWARRLLIALGSAKGLAYLHEDCHPRIIHRDIKAANILIDENFEAMVADFGLAKLSSDNYTHVSTRVMGTFGYLAPEYASSGKLTEKSDVFSFGVMLLELITGRKPVDITGTMMEDSLADWARPILKEAQEDRNYSELVDPRLEGNYNPQELACMAACAAAAIRHSGKRRPKMSQIVRALEGDASLEDLNEVGRGTAASGSASGMMSNGSSEYDTVAYKADMKRFRRAVLTSQEFVSGEHSSGESQEMMASQPHPQPPWKPPINPNSTRHGLP